MKKQAKRDKSYRDDPSEEETDKIVKKEPIQLRSRTTQTSDSTHANDGAQGMNDVTAAVNLLANSVMGKAVLLAQEDEVFSMGLGWLNGPIDD